MQSDSSPGLLQNKSLFLYVAVRITGTFTTQMVAVAVSWQMYSLTHSAFDLGLVGLVQFIPLVLFMLVVGLAADHFNRKIIISLSLALIAASYLLLAAGTLTGWISKDWIYFVAFLIGTAGAFEGTAIQSILPNIVSKEEFSRATAGISSLSQVATILGPSLGGFLYAVSPVFLYGLCGLLSAVCMILILFVRVTQNTSNREPVNLQTLLMGFSFIKGRPIVLGAISLDLFAVLFGGATALLPVYAATILHTGSYGLGFLRAAPAVGAMVVSFYLSRHPIERKVGRNMFIAVAVFGVATIVFAVSRSFALSCAALVLLGASDVVSVVIRHTLVQLETPDAMRGRVNSVNQLFIGTSNQLGEFESGLTASWFGAMPAAVIGGIGTIAIVAIWIRLFPSLAKIEHFDYDGR